MDKTEPGATAKAGLPAGTHSLHAAPGHADSRMLPEHARLEGCEITGLIGAGDFTIVYLAYDYALARHIAVKEYMPASLAERTANGHVSLLPQADAETYQIGLRSFLSEARLLARFDTPSLVKILRFWEANGTAYIAMPYYEGISLHQAVSQGRFDANEKRIRLVLEELFEAVDPLHRAQVYHPDIAPENILLLSDGRPLLLDFGAARRVVQAQAGGPAATLRPGYAPVEDYESISNLKRGPWTDVYALAAVAYFLIAGKAPPPAPARMAHDLMTPARQAGAARYSDPFLAALDHALAVMPQQRLQSVADFRRALGMPATRRSASGTGAPHADLSTVRWPEANAGRGAHAGTMPAAGNRFGLRNAALGLAIVALLAAAGFWGMQRTDPLSAGVESASPPVAVADKPADPPGPVEKPAPVPAASPAPEAAAATPTPEEMRWLVASSLNNASAYENYLAEYPNGRYAPIARTTLQNIRASASAAEPAPTAADPAQQEETLWNAVRKIDKPLAYESFLRKYPNGRYASTARSSLARLRPQPVDPDPPFDPPVVDATRRHFGPGNYQPRPGDRPVAAAPSVPVLPPPAAADRLAAVRPPETPRAARPPQVAEPAAISEPEPEPPVPAPPRTGRTLRVANQNMMGNFSPDPVTGLVSGSGRIVWDNGDQFDGTMVRGQKEGRGEFRWANGQRYRGDWSRDQPNGKGSIQFPNGDRYTGDVRNGLPNGTGTLVFANGNRYQGEVRDGQPNGSGVLTFANGNRYRGEVRNGLPQGTGTLRFSNGDTYAGAFRRGRSDGQGRYTWANGNYWEGEFRDDVKTANGRMQYASESAAASSGESPRGTSASGAAYGREADDVLR